METIEVEAGKLGSGELTLISGRAIRLSIHRETPSQVGRVAIYGTVAFGTDQPGWEALQPNQWEIREHSLLVVGGRGKGPSSSASRAFRGYAADWIEMWATSNPGPILKAHQRVLQLRIARVEEAVEAYLQEIATCHREIAYLSDLLGKPQPKPSRYDWAGVPIL